MTTENKQNVYAPKGGETPIIHISGDQLNTKTEKGCYQVEMNHNDIIAAGLPAETCNAGHFIIGYLFVSETGSHGTSQSGRTVGQTLLFGGCTDAAPTIYQRTGSYPRKTLSWSKWTKTVNDAVLKDELKEQGEKLKNEMLIPVEWGSASHINHYVTQGIYNITGERLNAADGLPIANSNPGHTIHARLLVLNSSIAGTGDVQDKCITQVLTLSNRTGGDGDVYIRTGQAQSTNMLVGGIGWEQWGKLQQNVEVGQVTSLNSYIGNGIYSGVYTDGSTFFETFVMVVINNYAVAGATGQVRSVSQFKYALGIDGNFSYKTRSGYGNTGISWGNWVEIDNKAQLAVETEKQRATAAETKLQNSINSLVAGTVPNGTITAEKLSADVREKVEKVPSLEENAAKEKNALVNGDTIVGLAREVYSRQGKVDTATFFKRTTAGGTSVSDGVATLKQIGGNIVKNYVDASFIGNETLGVVNGHIYYFSTSLFNGQLHFAETSTGVYSGWKQHSIISKATSDSITIAIEGDNALNTLLIDLTEMFGAGKEPTKEECDKMFGTMDALPQGLTIAQPTGLKSTGYNQWNPENVLINKTITDNAIVDGDKNIAIVECLPCKTGAGENNGYVIGYGEGDDWSDEGVEVYLSPLNPLDVGNGAELYMHKLEKDSTYGTYVPLIKGCLLVVTPTTDKLCAHLHWSGDRAKTDYEEYVESYVALPAVPEMSEWGLAGISISGTLAADTIDLDRMVYTKRVGCVDMGSLNYSYYENNNVFGLETFINQGFNFKGGGAILANAYTTASAGFVDSARPDKTIYAADNKIQRIHIKDSSYTDAESFKASLQGVMLYYELAEPEEYPIVTKTAPNYIGSDYGVEEFTGSKIPLAANILFYMRSLVSETRNFLDRLMAGLGVSDATTAADKIVASVTDGI